MVVPEKEGVVVECPCGILIAAMNGGLGLAASCVIYDRVFSSSAAFRTALFCICAMGRASRGLSLSSFFVSVPDHHLRSDKSLLILGLQARPADIHYIRHVASQLPSPPAV